MNNLFIKYGIGILTFFGIGNDANEKESFVFVSFFFIFLISIYPLVKPGKYEHVHGYLNAKKKERKVKILTEILRSKKAFALFVFNLYGSKTSYVIEAFSSVTFMRSELISTTMSSTETCK